MFNILFISEEVFSLIAKGDSRYPSGRVYAKIVKANIPGKHKP